MNPHAWLEMLLSDAKDYCQLNKLETTEIALDEAICLLRAEVTVHSKYGQNTVKAKKPKTLEYSLDESPSSVGNLTCDKLF